jgi:hypothetical protein
MGAAFFAVSRHAGRNFGWRWFHFWRFHSCFHARWRDPQQCGVAPLKSGLEQ